MRLAQQVTLNPVSNNAKHRQIPLLLTRPSGGNAAFWGTLDAQTQARLDMIDSPAVSLTKKDDMPPDVSAAIFTSSNGVAFSAAGAGRPAYCVGHATTQRAQEAGWNARFCGLTADALVKTLSRDAPQHPLTHLGGIHTRGDVAARLTAQGIKTTHTALYAQDPAPLNAAAQDALSQDIRVILPLFSPRTAAYVVEQMKPQFVASLHVIAFSDAVAQEASALNAIEMHVCAAPELDHMCAAVKIVAGSVTLG